MKLTGREEENCKWTDMIAIKVIPKRNWYV
jgi:hypothetical protein